MSDRYETNQVDTYQSQGIGGRTKSAVVAGTLAAAGIGFAASLIWPQLRRGKALDNRFLDLKGKKVVITGGSRGLGLQLAREFGREGARVFICARDREELEQAKADLEKRGIRADVFVCDVTNRLSVDAMISEVEINYGPIDVLVNNAGVIQVSPVENLEVGDYEEAMKVMFWGTLYPALAVLPSMVERRMGTICNITSIGGKVGIPHMAPYCAAKFAATGWSESVAAELRGKGVNIVTVIPGLMRTGSHRNAKFKGDEEKEFRWFSLGATLPGLAMNPQRASKEIVEAVKSGVSHRILSVPANVLTRAHGLMPEVTARLLSIANDTLLPSRGRSYEAVSGQDAERRLDSKLHRAITGIAPKEELNQPA